MNPTLHTQAPKTAPLTQPHTASEQASNTDTAKGPSTHQGISAGASGAPSRNKANGSNGTPPRNASLAATAKPYVMPTNQELQDIGALKGLPVEAVRETYEATFDAIRSVKAFSWENLDAQLEAGRAKLAAEAAKNQAKNGGDELGASSGQPGGASTKPVTDKK